MILDSEKYLSQATRLNEKIKIVEEKIERLERSIGSPSSPGFEAHNNTMPSTESPDVKKFMKKLELENRHKLMVAYGKQLEEAIDKIQNVDSRHALYYRYIDGLTWNEIGNRMHCSDNTAKRWARNGLLEFKLPENPIFFENF